MIERTVDDSILNKTPLPNFSVYNLVFLQLGS